MLKNKLLNIIVLGLFSIALALGIWNPFNPQIADEEETVSNSLVQGITVFTVFFLAVKQLIRQYKTPVGAWGISLFFFVLIFFMTTMMGSPSNIEFPIKLFLKLIIDIVLTILLFKFFSNNPEYITYSLLVYVVSCAVISILFVSGSLNSWIVMHSGRLHFFGENPNSTSTRIALGSILLCYYIFVNPLNWGKFRFSFIFLILPMIMMVVASGSRGSLLIMGLCIFLLFSYGEISFNVKILWLILMGLLLIIFFKYVFINYEGELSIGERMSEMFAGEDAGRGELNDHALNIFMSNPIFGYGDTGFKNEMIHRFGEHRTVHNLYYYILATTGILGAVPFFFFLGYMLIRSIKIVRKNILPTIIMIFVLLLVDKTGGVLTYSLIWYLFSIVLSENYIYRLKKNA